MNTEIYQIVKLKKGAQIPYHLLLLADETREAIDKYIYNSDVYIACKTESSRPIATFVLQSLGRAVVEIKNIAVLESLRGKGLGSFLIHRIETIARNAGYREVIVGTPDIAIPEIRFYEMNGYVKYDIRKDFFIDNYPGPIIENGVVLKDMQMLHKVLSTKNTNRTVGYNHNYQVSKEDNPEKTAQILEDRIYEYNAEQTNRTDGLLFARTVRDSEAVIIGGIAGWTWAGVCEITQFWVEEKSRRNGIGRMLLEAVEIDAKDKGCVKILIKTYSFQAPHFYEKRGYRVEHVLNDFPPGYTYYTLTKSLD